MMHFDWRQNRQTDQPKREFSARCDEHTPQWQTSWTFDSAKVSEWAAAHEADRHSKGASDATAATA